MHLFDIIIIAYLILFLEPPPAKKDNGKFECAFQNYTSFQILILFPGTYSLENHCPNIYLCCLLQPQEAWKVLMFMARILKSRNFDSDF